MKKKYFIIGISAAIIVLLIPIFIIYSKVQKWNNYIYPGVSVAKIDLSGKTKDEAKSILNSRFQNNIANKKVNILDEKNNYSLTFDQLQVKYDIDNAVNSAYNYGKNFNFYEKYRAITSQKQSSFELKASYNNNLLNNLVKGIGQKINKEALNAKIVRSGSGFTITPEQDGRKLDESGIEKNIAAAIDSDSTNGDIDIKAAVENVKAKITKEKLQSINSLIGSFKTDYASISSSERMNNIQLATAAINGTVLLPGDSFSFNGIVGERTAARGYKSAPVLIGNKSDMGLGGGICQVSTTLYNAVLKSGIKATVRAHHTLPSHYVSVGYDATVDYGNLDYKFKNTLNYPIYIEGSTDGGYVVFNIYSNSSLLSTTYNITSQVYAELQPNTKYVDDPTLPSGTTQIDQSPVVGHRVKVYLEAYKNGNLISKSLITDDTYSAVDGVVRRGTKK